MFNFFKRKSAAKTAAKLPEPGEYWGFYEDMEDPFPPKYRPVKIVNVKDGWVMYNMSDVLTGERMRISLFVSMYKQIG